MSFFGEVEFFDDYCVDLMFVIYGNCFDDGVEYCVVEVFVVIDFLNFVVFVCWEGFDLQCFGVMNVVLEFGVGVCVEVVVGCY